MVNPSEDIAAAEAAKSRAAAAKELRGKPGATKDGHLIPLLANVGKPSDAAKANTAPKALACSVPNSCSSATPSRRI